MGTALLFFRYYGLDDPATIILNTLLLFLVLFYVYPLKFFVNVFLVNVWLSPLTGGPMQIRDVRADQHGDDMRLRAVF